MQSLVAPHVQYKLYMFESYFWHFPGCFHTVPQADFHLSFNRLWTSFLPVLQLRSHDNQTLNFSYLPIIVFMTFALCHLHIDLVNMTLFLHWMQAGGDRHLLLFMCTVLSTVFMLKPPELYSQSVSKHQKLAAEFNTPTLYPVGIINLFQYVPECCLKICSNQQISVIRELRLWHLISKQQHEHTI